MFSAKSKIRLFAGTSPGFADAARVNPADALRALN
jgi:hypothetical protein